MSLWSWLANLFRRRPAPPPPAPPPPVPPPAGPWREQLLGLVNATRLRHGVLVLAADDALDATAQVQANRMAAARRLFHGQSDEVIGAGQRNPSEIFTGWMTSPGHRDRLLDPNYTRAGFGRAQDVGGVLYWVGDLQ